MTTVPAKNPCGSCPYRKDVPSGVWAEDEYDKLPSYDNPGSSGEQPMSVFFCHQQSGRLCGGWVGCHDMEDSIGFRLAIGMGIIPPEDVEAILSYKSPVPLFKSGAAAAEHGKADLDAPSEAAARVVEKVLRRPSPMGRREVVARDADPVEHPARGLA